MSLFRVIRPPIESVWRFAALHDVTQKPTAREISYFGVAMRKFNFPESAT